MKSSKVYLVAGSLCLALVTVVLLFATAYAVPALTPAWQSAQAQALTSRETEPLTGFYFGLEIEGKVTGYFTECSGIGSRNWVVDHKIVDESGKEIIQKIPGRLTWSSIILKRGITSNMDIWDWRGKVEEGKMDDARTNISIIMYNQVTEEVARWNFENAWPCRITGPSLPDSESNELGVEEVEIVHEGMTRVN